LGYSRAGAGALVFSKEAPDLLAGIRRCLWTLGALPKILVWDRQAGLVSRRYERASLIVTSNKPFSAWGEIFGDEIVAAAMIDRLVHHAEILALKGDSYRLKDRDLPLHRAAATSAES
jgi:hypothetical protein